MARKHKLPAGQDYVTIREVEALAPCTNGYLDALKALKCLPNPDGAYHHLARWVGVKRSAYGVDEHIPLSVVAEAQKSRLRYVFDVPRLKALLTKIVEARKAANKPKIVALKKQYKEVCQQYNKAHREYEKMESKVFNIQDKAERLEDPDIIVYDLVFTPAPKKKGKKS